MTTETMLLLLIFPVGMFLTGLGVAAWARASLRAKRRAPAE